METNSLNNLIRNLKSFANPQKAIILQKFFKTKPGQYGHGDVFWGINVPLVRNIAKEYKNLENDQLEKLLENKIHEVRLCALLIMVLKTKTDPKQMHDLYLKQIDFVNNWDLVDLSAPTIIGNFLLDKDCTLLYSLAKTNFLWQKRIAIVSTFAFIKQGLHDQTFNIAKILINDKQDLIQKSVGWMLREVGKRCSEKILEEFLNEHAATMPRTMLRYSVERMSDEKRRYFMQAKNKV